MSVALVEKGDFAGATTSASSNARFTRRLEQEITRVFRSAASSRIAFASARVPASGLSMNSLLTWTGRSAKWVWAISRSALSPPPTCAFYPGFVPSSRRACAPTVIASLAVAGCPIVSTPQAWPGASSLPAQNVIVTNTGSTGVSLSSVAVMPALRARYGLGGTVLEEDPALPLLERKGWRVFLTRTQDVDVSLADRVAFSESRQADIFISLHFNSSGGGGAEPAGLETYCLTPQGMPSSLTRGYPDDPLKVYPNNSFDAQNLQLAMGMHRALVRTTGAKDRGVRRARFQTVLRGQLCPAVLLEGGYLSNPEEARRIVNYWADEGVTWFKAYTTISRAALGAAIEEAHKRGLKFTGHLCSVSFREAVALGIDTLVPIGGDEGHPLELAVPEDLDQLQPVGHVRPAELCHGRLVNADAVHLGGLRGLADRWGE